MNWRDWQDAVSRAVADATDGQLQEVAAMIRAADLVITAGNGGSSSLASHMAQAIAKPCYGPEKGRAAVCLTDHTPTHTAHANDAGWETALIDSARPFMTMGLRCLFLLFSSSGKSPNVCELAKHATALKHKVVGFTGFDGGPLQMVSTLSLHTAASIYEIVEPVHDVWIHRIQYHLQ